MRGATLALLAGMLGAGSASAQGVEIQRDGQFFQVRVSPDPNDHAVYRAFYAVAGDRGSLAVQRGGGWLGDERLVNVRAANCPALAAALAALATLPMPVLLVGTRPAYDYDAERETHYDFSGFVRFANGGEGELSFTAVEVRDGPADPRALWARRLVSAFDRCAEARD